MMDGTELRRIRKERFDMTQGELAQLLGVTTAHVNRMESGKKAITATIHLLVTVLDRVPQALKLARAEVGL